jgi:hypothetical protein
MPKRTTYYIVTNMQLNGLYSFVLHRCDKGEKYNQIIYHHTDKIECWMITYTQHNRRVNS